MKTATKYWIGAGLAVALGAVFLLRKKKRTPVITATDQEVPATTPQREAMRPSAAATAAAIDVLRREKGLRSMGETILRQQKDF